MKMMENLFDKQFNDWKVLNEYIIDDKTRKVKWKCECKCGIIKYVFASDLKSNKSKRCHSCGIIYSNSQKNSIPLINTFWGKIKQSASVRNIEFLITKEQAYNKFLEQDKKCIYTKLDLYFNSSSVKTDGNASLDRIDSSKGYTIDNIQWVHKKVNQIKMDLSHDDFIKICYLVTNNSITPKDFNIDENIKTSNRKYYNKRNNCICGNLKLKTSKKCKQCYLID